MFPPPQALEAAEEKLDEKIDKLDKLDEDDVERLRRQRLDQLKRAQKQRQQWSAQGHGDYTEIVDEKTFFGDLKKEQRAVVHFYRSATRRCEIVDSHLATLARKHVETRFIKVNAEKSPFLCERLKIWMLPTIVLIKEGRTDHSIVGFEELGGRDSFTTEDLERLLLKHEVVLEQFCS